MRALPSQGGCGKALRSYRQPHGGPDLLLPQNRYVDDGSAVGGPSV